MITQTVEGDNVKLPTGPCAVPLEEQLGNMRRELRELAAKIEQLENHQHGSHGEVLIPVRGGSSY